MSHRCLTELRDGDWEAYYFKALQYGHYLWINGHAGRAILAVTRALYTDLPADAPILKNWPLPYAALHWIVQHHDSDHFPGNPRISFQHQATRLRRQPVVRLRARAWAVWALICDARPSLPGDGKQGITEPSLMEIEQSLKDHGRPNEARIWIQALKAV